jgi:hypothetical protein
MRDDKQDKSDDQHPNTFRTGYDSEEQTGDSDQAEEADRIPVITPEMLFKKMRIHWISVMAAATESTAILQISFITFLIMLSSNGGRIARRRVRSHR